MSDELEKMVDEEVVEKTKSKKRKNEVVEAVETEVVETVELPKRKKPVIDRSSLKSNNIPTKQTSFKNASVQGYIFKP